MSCPDAVEAAGSSPVAKPVEKEEKEDPEFFEAEPEKSRDDALIEKGNYIARVAVGLTLIGAAFFHVEREFGIVKHYVQPTATQIVEKGKIFFGFEEVRYIPLSLAGSLCLHCSCFFFFFFFSPFISSNILYMGL